MFYVNVTNNFVNRLTINGSKKVNTGGGTASTGRVGGTQTIEVPAMGTILVLDLARNKVPGYGLSETWGVLMRYQGLELYYRYEGDGKIELTVDEYGNVNVTSVQGSALIISLKDLAFQGA